MMKQFGGGALGGLGGMLGGGKKKKWEKEKAKTKKLFFYKLQSIKKSINICFLQDTILSLKL